MILEPHVVLRGKLTTEAHGEEGGSRRLLIVLRNLSRRLPLRGRVLGQLVIGEEPRTVLLDWATAGEREDRVHLIELRALERRTRRLALGAVLDVPVVVRGDVLRRTFQAVRPRLRDDVDNGPHGPAVLGGHAGRVDRHLLDRLEVQVRAERSRCRVGRVHAVHQERVVPRERAVRVDITRAHDARRRRHEGLIVPADRQPLEFLGPHTRLDRRVRPVHDRRLANHRDLHLLRGQLQHGGDRRRLVRFDEVVGERLLLEAWQLDEDRVLPERQDRE